MRLADDARRLERKQPVGVATDYRKLLVEYRRSQLSLTAENVKRLETVFDRAVKSLAAAVENAPEGTLASGYYGTLLAGMEATLTDLRSDYAQLLSGGMAELAQNAADREATTAALVKAEADARLAADLTQTLVLSSQAQVTVSFGRLALSAVERCAQRVYSDGWKLSDRLYRVDANMRQTIQDTLVQGIAEQVSARKLADRLRSALTEAGADNPRYQAMRIARTEIVTAHREAHILSTLDPATGGLKSYIAGVGWRLSMSHPHTDICDVWAEDDGDGLGAGNYLPENVPSDHPHGLCYTTTVLVEYPDVAAPSKEAAAEDVVESQVEYYAEKYDDPAARRWLEARQ